MHSKGRRTSVCREDVLTERGANPRTGIISPCILSGNSEPSDINDYVYVGWTQHEHKSVTADNERWRQDDNVWSLVERASGLRLENIGRKQIHAAKVRAQDMSGGQSLQELVENHEKTDRCTPEDTGDNFARKDTSLSSNGSASLPVDDSRVLPQSLFRIPRRAEGAASKDKTSRSFPAAGLDNGFHSYPSQSSRTQSPKHLIPRRRYKYGNLVVHEPYLKMQGFSSSIQDTSFRTSPSLPVNPNLKTTYRRPAELLPARLRGPPTLDSKSRDKRPQVKRVRAATSVPATRIIKKVGDSATTQTKVPPSLYRARAASSPYREAAWRKVRSTLKDIVALDASTCATREAFRLTQAWKRPEDKLPVEDDDDHERSLPLSSRDSVYTMEQTIIKDERTLERRSNVCNRIRLNENVPAAVETDFAQGTCHSSMIGRRKSKRDIKALFDSLLLVIIELTSPFNYDRIQRQLYNVIKQALLTLRQASWAIQMLKSQTAKIWDHLLAMRLMLMSILYLVMLLSVLATVLKVLRFIMWIY
ncbi:MAG: hypothetical protein L6R41_002653 [Letrouitia leprolyta]|nr:MAG: hypothetical protein L6R41_002653 [Letrouitia leprolyta]